MRVVVQRVLEASCIVDGNIISSVNRGLLLLVGICAEDNMETIAKMSKKIAHLRIFEDEIGKMNKSILDMKYEILSISQFTLCADTSGGNRPSFTKAMKPDVANELFELFCNQLQNDSQIHVQKGVFGAHMEIKLTNDGPVTIVLEF